MIKVSVILPVYNVEQYLGKCLDSIVNQTYKNLEIICVNDCSPDNCEKILQEYAEKDNRINVFKREKNGGLSAARNTGLELAKGDYIYFMDSDDWIDLDYIENMVKHINEKNVDILVNTNFISEYTSGGVQYLDYKIVGKEGEFLSREESIGITPPMSWTHLYRKSFLDKYNLKFPEGYIHEDVYFQYISEVYTDKIFAVHSSVYHHFERNDSIMWSRDKNNINFLYYRIANKIVEYYKNNNLDFRFLSPLNIPLYYPLIEKEEEYTEIKSMVAKMREYINQNASVRPFDKFCNEYLINSENYNDFKRKSTQDLRLEFIRNKMRKSQS